MIDAFPHDDLIDFIDGTLDPDRAEELRRALEKDPEGRRMLDDLRRQGQILGELPEPRLSAGQQAELDALVRAQMDAADLEPDAARPMLFDDIETWQDTPAATAPGAYRRRHQRARTRRMVGRMASAAALFFAVSGGGLLIYNAVFVQSNGLTNTVASNDEDNVEPTDANPRTAVTGNDVALPPADGSVHHMPTRNAAMMTSAGSGTMESGAADPSAAPTFVRADLAMRFDSPSDDFLAVLSTLVDETHERRIAMGDAPAYTASLFRNLDYDTAVRVATEVASTDGQAIDLNTMPWRVDATTREALLGEVARRVTENGAESIDQRLAGAAQLMPTLSSQLTFSSAGAELTVTLHASDIPAFLEKLEQNVSARTAIDFIPVDRAERHDADWITMRRQLAERLAEWSQTDTIVQIPVVIRQR